MSDVSRFFVVSRWARRSPGAQSARFRGALEGLWVAVRDGLPLGARIRRALGGRS